jgi:hypothetical protein
MSISLPAQKHSIDYNSDLGPNQAYLRGQQGIANDRLGQTYGVAEGGYSGLVKSQGYSPQEQGAIATTGENGIRTGYAGLRDTLARRAARTGNTAGYFGGLATAGEGQARDMASQERQNVVDFANEKERRQEAGLKGEADLFGQTSTNANAANDFRTRLAALQKSTLGSGGSSSYLYGGNYGKT